MSFYIDNGEMFFDSESKYSLQQLIQEYKVDGLYNSQGTWEQSVKNNFSPEDADENPIDTPWQVSSDYNFTTRPQDTPTNDVNITTAVEGGTILNLYGNYEVQIDDSTYTVPVYTGYNREAAFEIKNVEEQNYYKMFLNGKNLGSDMFPQTKHHVQTLEFKNSSTPEVYKLRIGDEETDCFSKNVSNMFKIFHEFKGSKNKKIFEVFKSF